MTSIKIKRVYEDFAESDGFRILVDRLWPRGIKKENLHYDLWAKDLTPSSDLRIWFHQDVKNHWDSFVASYQKELAQLTNMDTYINEIELHAVVTLLYAAKDPVYNHAIILKKYLDTLLESKS